MSILIVDDDPDILDYLQDLLSEVFVDVPIVKASNGSQALQFCLETSFDLICTDYSMPVMDGMQFVQSLRKEEGLNSGTSVVFLSGYVSRFKSAAECMQNVSILEKPASVQKLVDVAKASIQNPARKVR